MLEDSLYLLHGHAPFVLSAAPTPLEVHALRLVLKGRTIPRRSRPCDAQAAHRATIRGDWGHAMLRQRIASQSEVVGAIVSGYSPCMYIYVHVCPHLRLALAVLQVGEVVSLQLQ